VLNVTSLLKTHVRAVALPATYDEHGDDGLLMQLLMAECGACRRARWTAAARARTSRSCANAYSPTCPRGGPAQ